MESWLCFGSPATNGLNNPLGKRLCISHASGRCAYEFIMLMRGRSQWLVHVIVNHLTMDRDHIKTEPQMKRGNRL